MTAQYETNAIGVQPGDTQQLMLQAPADLVLKDFAPDHGLELVWYVAGATKVKPPEGSKPGFGQKVKAKEFITAMVRNTTDQLIIGKGVWFVDGANLPKQAQTAQAMSGIIPMAKKPVLANQATSNRNASTGGKNNGRITSYPVGRNELAICMGYGEAKRLLDAISGGAPIIGAERPAFARRFNTAFAIFETNTLPPEPDDITPEKEKAYQTEILTLNGQNQELSRIIGDQSGEIDTLHAKLQEAEAQLVELRKAKAPNRDPESLENLNKEVFEAGYEKAMVDVSTYATHKLKTSFTEMQMDLQTEASRVKPQAKEQG